MSSHPRPSPSLAPFLRDNDVAALITASSHELEVARWLVPREQEAGERRRIHNVARIHVHHALRYGDVELAQQRHGIARVLLDTHHNWVDQTRTPTHLIAASNRARAIPQRHGYTDRAGPIHLPNRPTHWPVRREANQPGTSR